ncbi:glycosyltransferase family 1 protein [Tropicimonas sp. TH_r6]|uniref:glycosyltransferase family 4 protein n=1 Tax=Tropicimonas sp. TH_r6 TaxID=3082085 RepID=UPI0029535EBC|nr:glycosyltransferase family 1 protein [Tropicimonas sp. TH_r6]MDV7144337.1 glycosyltransferase family 1 protein [Tropicimonas sp. TH_r6]
MIPPNRALHVPDAFCVGQAWQREHLFAYLLSVLPEHERDVAEHGNGLPAAQTQADRPGQGGFAPSQAPETLFEFPMRGIFPTTSAQELSGRDVRYDLFHSFQSWTKSGGDMSRPFRILFDAHTFDAGWQGTTTYLAGVLNALPEAMERQAPGQKVEIFCAAAAAEPISQSVTTPYTFIPIRTGFIARNAVDIPRVAAEVGADLVVSQYVRPFRSSCPTLSVIHDVLFLDYPDNFSWTFRKIRELVFGWSARHSTMVATVSRYSAERIEAHFGIPSESILLTPNSVDPAFASAERPRNSTGQRPLRLLSVSRLERRKRHEWGIRAVERLKQAGIAAEYLIIGGGEGPYADRLEAEVASAREAGLSVDLKGGVSFRDLVAAYSRADLFLCPSESEGFGIPVIEAAAAGTPCVVSDGGALAEFDGLFEGESFPAENEEAFLSAVERVAADIEICLDQAATRRHEIADRYQWSNVADVYATAVLELGHSAA